MQYSFDQLLDILLSLLEAAPACSSRDQAFEQLRTLWLQTHTYFAAPESELRRIAGRRLVEPHGWKDLDKDPATWTTIPATAAPCASTCTAMVAW